MDRKPEPNFLLTKVEPLPYFSGGLGDVVPRLLGRGRGRWGTSFVHSLAHPFSKRFRSLPGAGTALGVGKAAMILALGRKPTLLRLSPLYNVWVRPPAVRSGKGIEEPGGEGV